MGKVFWLTKTILKSILKTKKRKSLEKYFKIEEIKKSYSDCFREKYKMGPIPTIIKKEEPKSNFGSPILKGNIIFIPYARGGSQFRYFLQNKLHCLSADKQGLNFSLSKRSR